MLAASRDDAETLSPLERSSSPMHDRRKVALERQRAIAMAEREVDRKHARLRAQQETLRESGYGISTMTEELDKREAATAQREAKLRAQEELGGRYRDEAKTIAERSESLVSELRAETERLSIRNAELQSQLAQD